MKKGSLIIALLALVLGLVQTVHAQGKPDFKVLKATVISVSEHPGAAYTIEIKVDTPNGKRYDSLTIDPRCTFYKDDTRPKTINIIKPGDLIEATYLTSQGVKSAFNIVVLPQS